jgi:hypothetical protein
VDVRLFAQLEALECRGIIEDFACRYEAHGFAGLNFISKELLLQSQDRCSTRIFYLQTCTHRSTGLKDVEV